MIQLFLHAVRKCWFSIRHVLRFISLYFTFNAMVLQLEWYRMSRRTTVEWYFIPASTANLYELKFTATVSTIVLDQCLPLLLRMRKGLFLGIVCVCGVRNVRNVSCTFFSPSIPSISPLLGCIWMQSTRNVQNGILLFVSWLQSANIAQSNCAWTDRDRKTCFCSHKLPLRWRCCLIVLFYLCNICNALDGGY